MSRKRGVDDWLTQGLPARAEALIPSRLHPKQLEFIALPHLEALYGGAAGGGKTEALLADALQHVVRPNFRALILRRTFKALNLPGSVMSRALEWLGRTHWNDNEKRFHFPSGAIIQFGYCDNEGDLDRYKSAQFHKIYIDEVTEWPENWYTFLFSRIRKTVGDTIPLGMRAATNPDGIGAEWVRRRFEIPEGEVVAAPIEGDDRIFLPARADDNPSLDLVSYEKSLSKLSPEKYQQLRWGRWIRDGEGLVYKHFDDARNCVSALPPLDFYMLGLDYGFVDQTAFCVLGWAKHDRTVYVVEAFKLSGVIPSDAAARVAELEGVYRFQRIVGDVGGLGKGYAEEARQRWALPIEPAEKTNKRGYIDLLNGALAKGELRLLRPACDALRKEWIELPWDEGREKESPGFNNHCADACLYAWRAVTAWAERDAPPLLSEEGKIAAARDAKREELRARHEAGGNPLARPDNSFRRGSGRWGR